MKGGLYALKVIQKKQKENLISFGEFKSRTYAIYVAVFEALSMNSL